MAGGRCWVGGVARYLTRDRAAVAAGVLVPLAVAAVLLPLRSSWSNTNVALLLVVAVVAVAAIGNRLAGALAAVSAAAWFDFFFTVPYDRFVISRPDDIRTAVLLLVVGVAVSQLAARARRLKVIAITDARYLAEIHETAELAHTAKSPDEVVDHVRTQLVGLLGLAGMPVRVRVAARPPAAAGSQTAASWSGTTTTTSRNLGCRPGRSSCGPSATGSTTGGSCCGPSRSPGPRCRLAWSRSPWPTRLGAPSASAEARRSTIARMTLWSTVTLGYEMLGRSWKS